MKYIFLAIVLLCISLLVYINYFHQKSLKEGLSYSEQAANLVNQEKYYDYRIFGTSEFSGHAAIEISTNRYN